MSLAILEFLVMKLFDYSLDEFFLSQIGGGERDAVNSA